MNFTEYMYGYELKQRQIRLNNHCSLKAGFDEKLFLKKIFAKRHIFAISEKDINRGGRHERFDIR